MFLQVWMLPVGLLNFFALDEGGNCPSAVNSAEDCDTSGYLSSAALYLGLWVGPGAGVQSWDLPLARYTDRVDKIASMHCGLWISIVLYRALAFSTLVFVAQACEIPSQALVVEEISIRKLVGGPYNWLPLQAAFLQLHSVLLRL